MWGEYRGKARAWRSQKKGEREDRAGRVVWLKFYLRPHWEVVSDASVGREEAVRPRPGVCVGRREAIKPRPGANKVMEEEVKPRPEMQG